METLKVTPEPQRLRTVAAVHSLLTSQQPPGSSEPNTVIAVTFADMGLDSNKAKAEQGPLQSFAMGSTHSSLAQTIQSVAEYFASSLLAEHFRWWRARPLTPAAPAAPQAPQPSWDWL